MIGTAVKDQIKKFTRRDAGEKKDLLAEARERLNDARKAEGDAQTALVNIEGKLLEARGKFTSLEARLSELKAQEKVALDGMSAGGHGHTELMKLGDAAAGVEKDQFCYGITESRTFEKSGKSQHSL